MRAARCTLTGSHLGGGVCPSAGFVGSRVSSYRPYVSLPRSQMAARMAADDATPLAAACRA
eukprot:6793801-Prymnesium_polylepis.1